MSHSLKSSLALIMIKSISPSDSEILAIIHKATITPSWSAASFTDMLNDPTVVGWHTLVPIHVEPFRSQTRDRTLGQKLVLKTAARQSDALFSRDRGNFDHHLNERVVKFSCDS